MASLDEGSCEAGIFALMPSGWALVERRGFADSDSAFEWMERRACTWMRRHAVQKVRGNIVSAEGSLTLDMVLADYEQQRKSVEPELNEPKTPVSTKAEKVTASFTHRQGQYLAFIYNYTKLNGRPPAEADMQRHFKVTPPVVHAMILMLEKMGLIARTPGMARSIQVLLKPELLPPLE